MEINLKNTIESIILKAQGNLKNEIKKIWDKEIPPEIKKHANISHFKKGILYIKVNDSNFLYWIYLKKKIIEEKFKTLLDKNLVKEIKFRVKNG